VDRAQDEAGQLKSQSYLACSHSCSEALKQGLLVEHSMLGVETTATAAQAIAAATKDRTGA
jgi:hypothetical protein